MRIFMAAMAFLLAACGGADLGDVEVTGQPIQTYRNCRYEYQSAGILPAMYAYRCWIRTECDRSDACTSYVRFAYPECEPGATTCEACPPGRLIC